MMRIWSGFGFLFIFLLLPGSIIGSVEDEFVVVVVREPIGPSVAQLRNEILQQVEGFIRPAVYVVPDELPDVKGAWTLLPLFPKLLQLNPNATWLIVLRDNTRLDYSELVRLTQRFDAHKEWFIGHELYDEEASIVHHFAFHHDPSAFKYPHLEAGVVLSRPVLHRVGARIAREQPPRDFAIDVQHELALYLTDGVNLTHSPAFCLRPGLNCATWIQPFVPCGAAVDLSELYFAVKTCAMFHGERVPIVQQTWAGQTSKITFFSDLADESIPTVSLGVANTESGHCSKTMAIIDYLSASEMSWYIITDDDTILGVQKLRQWLSCYDPTLPLLMGQKYGYASGHNYGYDYITGGGGMVLSRAAIQLIAGSDACRCPRSDTPDDMWVGACAEALGIMVVHFPGFHQARPEDYPSPLLRSQFVISFHKHWMIDPLQVYSHWFSEAGSESLTSLGPSEWQQLSGQPEKSGLFQSSSRELPDEL